MALVDDDAAIALQELFAGMDAAQEDDAASAMNETAAFLRKHRLSFRYIVQETDARGLLLPSKVGAAIQLMDSTTLSEATRSAAALGSGSGGRAVPESWSASYGGASVRP